MHVYWTVNEKYQVTGTTSIESASAFYITSAGDPSHPSDFFILYYGNDKGDKQTSTHLFDSHIKLQEKYPLLPWYLMSHSSFLGFSEKPLELRMAVKTSQAQFSLHSRVQSSSMACLMCRTTGVDISSWLQGEQFYISHNKHSVKFDGYIAMAETKTRMPEFKTRPQAAETSSIPSATKYQTVTVLTIKDPSNSKYGMLFQLHPLERVTQRAAINPLDNECQRKEDDLYEKLIKHIKEGSTPKEDPKPAEEDSSPGTELPKDSDSETKEELSSRIKLLEEDTEPTKESNGADTESQCEETPKTKLLPFKGEAVTHSWPMGSSQLHHLQQPPPYYAGAAKSTSSPAANRATAVPVVSSLTRNACQQLIKALLL